MVLLYTTVNSREILNVKESPILKAIEDEEFYYKKIRSMKEIIYLIF